MKSENPIRLTQGGVGDGSPPSTDNVDWNCSLAAISAQVNKKIDEFESVNNEYYADAEEAVYNFFMEFIGCARALVCMCLSRSEVKEHDECARTNNSNGECFPNAAQGARAE